MQDRLPGFPFFLMKWSGPCAAWYVQLFVLSVGDQLPWQRSTPWLCAGIPGRMQMLPFQVNPDGHDGVAVAAVTSATSLTHQSSIPWASCLMLPPFGHLEQDRSPGF